MKALVGYTGFVGSNLMQQASFDLLINSKNSSQLKNQSLDLLVFSGARAEKWKANQNPQEDQAHIENLIQILKSVKAERAVLISTIDVYQRPIDVDENDKPNLDGLHPYGKNRYLLETFFTQHFAHSQILRLPGLFGPGIKKNAIYDFLHNNQIEKIDSRGSFQFYDLANLWRDIQTLQKLQVPLLNMATEPFTISMMARECFGRDFKNETLPSPAKYNMKSKYAQHWSGKDGYLYSRTQILESLKSFVRSFKRTS